MKIEEDMAEIKIPRPVGVRAVGIAVSVAVLDSLGIFVAMKINVQNNQRIVPRSYKKKDLTRVKDTYL